MIWYVSLELHGNIHVLLTRSRVNIVLVPFLIASQIIFFNEPVRKMWQPKIHYLMTEHSTNKAFVSVMMFRNLSHRIIPYTLILRHVVLL